MTGKGRPQFGFGSGTIRLDQSVQLKVMHFVDQLSDLKTKNARAQKAADLLNQLGASTSRGTCWSANSIKAVMEDSLYSRSSMVKLKAALQELGQIKGLKNHKILCRFEADLRHALISYTRRCKKNGSGRLGKNLSLQDQLLLSCLAKDVDQGLVAHLLGFCSSSSTFPAISRQHRSGSSCQTEYCWIRFLAEVFLQSTDDKATTSEFFVQQLSRADLLKYSAKRLEVEFVNYSELYASRLKDWLSGSSVSGKETDLSMHEVQNLNISNSSGQGPSLEMACVGGSAWIPRWHSFVDSIQRRFDTQPENQNKRYEKVRALWFRLLENESTLEQSGFVLEEKLSTLVRQVASGMFSNAYRRLTTTLSEVNQLAQFWIQYLAPELLKIEPFGNKACLPIGVFPSHTTASNSAPLDQISSSKIAFSSRHEIELVQSKFHSGCFDDSNLNTWSDFLGVSFKEFGSRYSDIQSHFREIRSFFFRSEDEELVPFNLELDFGVSDHPKSLEELFRTAFDDDFLKLISYFEAALLAGFHQVLMINNEFRLRNPAFLETVLLGAIFTELLTRFLSRRTGESKSSEITKSYLRESIDCVLFLSMDPYPIEEAKLVQSLEESKAKPDRSARRQDFIWGLTSTEPAAAGHLAWSDFEWTLKRAIRLLSSHTSVDVPLSQLAERFIGLPELEQCWEDQVRPQHGRSLSDVVPHWENLISESSKLRTLDIHGIGRELDRELICERVESVLSATKLIIDFVASKDKDIFTDPRLCEDDPSYS